MADSNVYVKPPVWALLTAVVIGGLFYIGGKQIEAEDDPADEGAISVSGEGRAFAVPDIAEINLGVSTGRQATAAAAMAKLQASMDAVVNAVKSQGVEDKDIRTESYWLSPVYDYVDGRQIPRGFEANQSVRVKVRDIDNASAVIEAGTSAGSNQVGSINFTMDDPEELRSRAREEAIAEAKEKAKVLADQLGVRLGEIKSFSEGYGGGYPVPMYYDRAVMNVGGGADEQMKAALPAGEQEVVVNVSITYELE